MGSAMGTSERVKVAFISIFYPVFMGRYILEALRRREDVELWTAGPFSNRWIPWNDGMLLPEPYVYYPNHAIPMDQPPQVIYSWLRKECPFEPDLWLEVNAGLRAIGRPKGKYAIVGTDPHVLNDTFYRIGRREADYFFCMQKPYIQNGDIWLPYAYDPVWHAPSQKEWEEREFDVSLLGLRYQQRHSLFSRLKDMGLATCFDLGPSYEDARKIYHNTRIGVNWSSLQDTTARVFELMSLGVVPVLNRVPDLLELFEEDEHFIGFGSIEEAILKIAILLGDKKYALRVIDNAKEAVQPHSWDARVEQILKDTNTI